MEVSTNMGLTGDYWGIFRLFVLVIAFSAQCALFSKAGLPWERAFVPVYGVWSFFRLADSTLIFFLAPGVQLLLGLTGLLAYDIVQIIFTLFLIILYGVFCTRLARAFGKGKGFALGLILLYPVFLTLLAFGGAEYDDTIMGLSKARTMPPWTCTCGTANEASRGACAGCGKEKPYTAVWHCPWPQRRKLLGLSDQRFPTGTRKSR